MCFVALATGAGALGASVSIGALANDALIGGESPPLAERDAVVVFDATLTDHAASEDPNYECATTEEPVPALFPCAPEEPILPYSEIKTTVESLRRRPGQPSTVNATLSTGETVAVTVRVYDEANSLHVVAYHDWLDGRESDWTFDNAMPNNSKTLYCLEREGVGRFCSIARGAGHGEYRGPTAGGATRILSGRSSVEFIYTAEDGERLFLAPIRANQGRGPIERYVVVDGERIPWARFQESIPAVYGVVTTTPTIEWPHEPGPGDVERSPSAQDAEPRDEERPRVHPFCTERTLSWCSKVR